MQSWKAIPGSSGKYLYYMKSPENPGDRKATSQWAGFLYPSQPETSVLFLSMQVFLLLEIVSWKTSEGHHHKGIWAGSVESSNWSSWAFISLHEVLKHT